MLTYTRCTATGECKSNMNKSENKLYIVKYDHVAQ